MIDFQNLPAWGYRVGDCTAWVYALINTRTDRMYIGATRHPKERMTLHFRQLKNGIHTSKALQADYNIHGQDCFIVIPLREYSPTTINLKDKMAYDEQLLIQVLSPYYNKANKVKTDYTCLIRPLLKKALEAA